MKQNALSEFCGTWCCFIHYLTENLRPSSSVKAGIVLNLFLNFEQKEPRVLIKKCTKLSIEELTGGFLLSKLTKQH